MSLLPSLHCPCVPAAYLRHCALCASLATLGTSLWLSCALRAGLCSALRFVLTSTMASADFCTSIPPPCDVGSTEVALGTPADLPGMTHPPPVPPRFARDGIRFADRPSCVLRLRLVTLMPVGYTSQRSVQVSGFDDICRLTPLQRLIRFLFVRPALCFRLPPDSQSPTTPLPFS